MGVFIVTMKEIKLNETQREYLTKKIRENIKLAPCAAHPEMGDCWNWQMAMIKDGYGQLYLGGRAMRVHRASYAAYIADIPNDMCILHKCDNPGCCNPDHLRLGTVEENVQDRVNKRRGAVGSRVNTAKLTDVDIPEIIRLRKEGLTLKDLGLRFGVHLSMIQQILRGKCWKHLNRENLCVDSQL